MKRCFLISGPMSCGNRLLAAALVRCGCVGSGSTRQILEDILGENKIVYIVHHPEKELFDKLRAENYAVTVLITARDAYCYEMSMKRLGFSGDELKYDYRRLFSVIPDDAEYVMVPYEALVLSGYSKLISRLGLEIEKEKLVVNEQIEEVIRDENAKYYGVTKPEDTSFHGAKLTWFPEEEFGYYPVPRTVYGEDYFAKYVTYSQTDLGKAITEARVNFVNKHCFGPVVDVGIGCGQFVTARKKTVGFDVNPVAVDWLQSRKLFVDPRYAPFPAATFWDSLEHINNPQQILRHIRRYIFVSIPIHSGPSHILQSKHFRKDEHHWYFTKDGFVRWMKKKGFDLLEIDDFETRLGREDILSFAFKRTQEV